LRTRGYDLDVRDASDPKIALRVDGEYSYGGLVLLCPTATAVARRLPVTDLERFINSGRSILLVTSQGFSEYTQGVAQAFGVDLDDREALVVDHQRVIRDLDDGSATFVRAGGQVESPFLFGSAATVDGAVAFRGPGAQLFADNELVDSLIWGSGSSFAYKPATQVTTSPHTSGTATVLGAGLSTRVGGRLSYFGSLEALSDRVFDVAGTSHETALTTFAGWAFGHSGVLRAQNLRYAVEDRARWEETGVRVKDIIRVEVDIHSWNGESGEWVDFAADDVQIEFVMLNPWVRARLAHAGSNGTYSATIQVPDQIGIYKFAIQYHRPGVSSVVLEHVVPVRPFLHNEYPRFIPMAYPYYIASFSMLLVVFLLGLVLMYGNAAVMQPPSGKGAARGGKGSTDASLTSRSTAAT
jgi:oligosaccharyltransferase complex subunit beta